MLLNKIMIQKINWNYTVQEKIQILSYACKGKVKQTKKLCCLKMIFSLLGKADTFVS